jgi:hypothetical protein
LRVVRTPLYGVHKSVLDTPSVYVLDDVGIGTGWTPPNLPLWGSTGDRVRIGIRVDPISSNGFGRSRITGWRKSHFSPCRSRSGDRVPDSIMGVAQTSISDPQENPLGMSYAGVVHVPSKWGYSIPSVPVTKYPRSIREVNRIPYSIGEYFPTELANTARQWVHISCCVGRITAIFSDGVLSTEEIGVVNTNPNGARWQCLAAE